MKASKLLKSLELVHTYDVRASPSDCLKVATVVAGVAEFSSCLLDRVVCFYHTQLIVLPALPEPTSIFDTFSETTHGRAVSYLWNSFILQCYPPEGVDWFISCRDSLYSRFSRISDAKKLLGKSWKKNRSAGRITGPSALGASMSCAP